MKIQYITTLNSSDIHIWSGLNYFIAKSLIDNGLEIEYVENLKKKLYPDLVLKKLYYKFIEQKNFSLEVEEKILKNYAQQVSSKINSKSDLIFSPSTIPISFLETNKPKVFYVDTLINGLLDYNKCSNLCNESIRSAIKMEQQALTTSSLALFSSDWAAKIAIENYDVSPEKVKVVPFGANITNYKSKYEIEQILKLKSKTECNLLFIGVDWKRKGGEYAVEITKKLNENGIKTFLHVVGVNDLSAYNYPDFIINHGFISKSTEMGIRKLEELYLKCHFFVLPTKAEAYGLVFCEANSYGLPSIGSDVGGIPTIIKNGKNGFTFPIDIIIDESVNVISEYFSNHKIYSDLSLSSFNEFEYRLNWKVAGETIKQLLTKI